MADKDFLLTFNEALLGIVRAGIPLNEGLVSAAKEMENPQLAEAMQRLNAKVSKGQSLSEAMGEYGDLFPESYVSMIAVGEHVGSLTGILEHLLRHYRRQSHFRSCMVSALSYPLAVSLFTMAILTGILTTIMPKFLRVFTELGAPIPPLTAWLMKLTQFFMHDAILVLPLVILFLGYVIYRIYFCDILESDWKILQHFPFFARIFSYLHASTFLSLMGTLLQHGVPMVTALRLVKGSMTSARARSEIDLATVRIQRGEAAADAIGDLSFVPGVIAVMLRNNTDMDDLGRNMSEMSDFWETKSRNLQSDFITLVEPALIVALGFGIGLIVIALYLPLFTVGGGIVGV